MHARPNAGAPPALSTPRALAGDPSVQRAERALADQPWNIARYLDLAWFYALQQEDAAARAVLRQAAGRDPTRTLLQLDLAFVPRDGPDGQRADDGPRLAVPWRDTERTLLAAVEDDEVLQAWVHGLVQIETGRFDEAEDTFVRLVGRDAIGHPRFQLAVAQLGRRAWDTAVETLEAMLTEHPDDTAVRTALATVFLERRQFARARTELDRTIAVAGHDALAHYLLGLGLLERDPLQAVEALRAAVAEDPSVRPWRFALARASRLAGLTAAAVQVYRDLIQERPDDFEAHVQLGSVFKLLGDVSRFRRQSIEEGASPLSVAGARGALLEALDRQAADYRRQAMAELATALSIEPLDSRAVRQVAEIYRTAGRLDHAVQAFEWLARRDPTQWITLYRLGTVLIELGRADEAIDVLRRAVELAPAQGDTYVALGLAYQKAGRRRDAIAAFETGTIYEPFNPALYTNLGALYAYRGDHDRATRYLRRTIELGTFPLPRVHLAYTNLALLHLAAGRSSDATEALETALHVFPDYPPARELLDRLASGGGTASLRADWRDRLVFNEMLEIFGEVTTVAFEDDGGLE